MIRVARVARVEVDGCPTTFFICAFFTCSFISAHMVRAVGAGKRQQIKRRRRRAAAEDRENAAETSSSVSADELTDGVAPISAASDNSPSVTAVAITPEEMVMEATICAAKPNAIRKVSTSDPRSLPRAVSLTQIVAYIARHFAASDRRLLVDDDVREGGPRLKVLLGRLVTQGALRNENAHLGNVRPLYRITSVAFEAVKDILRDRRGVTDDQSAEGHAASSSAEGKKAMASTKLFLSEVEQRQRKRRKARKSAKRVQLKKANRQSPAAQLGKVQRTLQTIVLQKRKSKARRGGVSS